MHQPAKRRATPKFEKRIAYNRSNSQFTMEIIGRINAAVDEYGQVVCKIDRIYFRSVKLFIDVLSRKKIESEDIKTLSKIEQHIQSIIDDYENRQSSTDEDAMFD